MRDSSSKSSSHKICIFFFFYFSFVVLFCCFVVLFIFWKSYLRNKKIYKAQTIHVWWAWIWTHTKEHWYSAHISSFKLLLICFFFIFLLLCSTLSLLFSFFFFINSSSNEDIWNIRREHQPDFAREPQTSTYLLVMFIGVFGINILYDTRYAKQT